MTLCILLLQERLLWPREVLVFTILVAWPPVIRLPMETLIKLAREAYKERFLISSISFRVKLPESLMLTSMEGLDFLLIKGCLTRVLFVTRPSNIPRAPIGSNFKEDSMVPISQGQMAPQGSREVISSLHKEVVVVEAEAKLSPIHKEGGGQRSFPMTIYWGGGFGDS